MSLLVESFSFLLCHCSYRVTNLGAFFLSSFPCSWDYPWTPGSSVTTSESLGLEGFCLFVCFKEPLLASLICFPGCNFLHIQGSFCLPPISGSSYRSLGPTSCFSSQLFLVILGYKLPFRPAKLHFHFHLAGSLCLIFPAL